MNFPTASYEGLQAPAVPLQRVQVVAMLRSRKKKRILKGTSSTLTQCIHVLTFLFVRCVKVRETFKAAESAKKLLYFSSWKTALHYLALPK